MLSWSVFFAVLCTSWHSASGAWKYPEDPANGWAVGDCAAGTKQSPIDIPDDLPATIHSPIQFKNYFTNPDNNNKWFKGLLENNGHTVVWHISKNTTAPFKKCGKHFACPSIRNGPFGGSNHTHAYYLLQAHFHWGSLGDNTKGSEHKVGGMAYPMEMHLVHIEDQFVNLTTGLYDWDGAIADPFGLAVIAIFFKVDNTKPQNMKPLQKIDNEVAGLPPPPPDRRDAEEPAEDDHLVEMRNLALAVEDLGKNRVKRDEHSIKLRLNIGAFLRKVAKNGGDGTLSTYWSYHGSLTTPECNEAVTWVVFARALGVAQVQVNAFASLFADNFRKADCTACATHSAPAANDLVHLIHDEIGKCGGMWG